MTTFRSTMLLEDAAKEPTAGDTAKPPATPAPEKKEPKEAPAGDVLAAKAKEFEEVMEDNRAIFDASKTPEVRETAARRHFARLGYTRAQIDEWVSSNITGSDGDPDPDQGRSPDPKPQRNTQLDEARKDIDKIQTQLLNTSFKSAVEKAMLESPEIKVLMDAAGRLRKSEDLPKVRELVAKTLQQEALKLIKARIDRTGEKISPDWIPDEVSKAVKNAVEQHSAVIGDPSSVGRSLETSTSPDPFANRKRAPAPSYATGKSIGEVEQEAIAWMTDELSDLARKVPSSKGESKV